MRITAFSIAIAVVTAASVWAEPSGKIVGCVTDTSGQTLPNVTVVARSTEKKVTTVADAHGCYEFDSLMPNVYRMTARLKGFDNQTRDHVEVAAGSIARVDVRMAVSAICECMAPPDTIRKLWEGADRVVHLRITYRDMQLPAPPGYFVHTATVLETLKSSSDQALGDAGMFMQGQASGEPDPYYFGEEFVVFLRSGPSSRLPHVDNHTPWVFAVEDGRRVLSPFSVSGETRLDDLLLELRALKQLKK